MAVVKPATRGKTPQIAFYDFTLKFTATQLTKEQLAELIQISPR